MAIVKVAKSKKSVMFIDDFGNSFITSMVFLQGLLEGKGRTPFILLKRLPNPVNMDRFMKSPLLEFDASGKVVSEKKGVPIGPVGGVKASEDGMSLKSTKDKDQARVYSAKVIV